MRISASAGYVRAGSAVVAAATPDEVEPAAATYEDGVLPHWRYQGLRAVQGWRIDSPSPAVQAVVNGRDTYWASASKIPGGISFENFEMYEPYRPGIEQVFWVEPLVDDADLEPAIARHLPDPTTPS